MGFAVFIGPDMDLCAGHAGKDRAKGTQQKEGVLLIQSDVVFFYMRVIVTKEWYSSFTIAILQVLYLGAEAFKRLSVPVVRDAVEQRRQHR